MKREASFEALLKGDVSKNALSEILLLRGEWQEKLFALARQKRQEYFPDGRVEVRSVIEVSNICKRRCNFCNMSSFSKIKRGYIISYEEMMKQAACIYSRGRRVILIQSGENKSQKYIDFISKCLIHIKQNFEDLIIILCLGELDPQQYRQLRLAGADRYILKFETSNSKLFEQIKPDEALAQRIECLKVLHKVGFEVGSGNIIGLPNQTIEDIVNDLLFIGQLNLTMSSASVFIPGEHSKYSCKPKGDCDTALNYMALMRILYPQMLIPCVSALEKAKEDGQFLGLTAGANIVTIHDGTPEALKKLFPIYSVERFIPDEKYMRNIVLKAGLSFM